MREFGPVPSRPAWWAWLIVGVTVALVPLMVWLMAGVTTGGWHLLYKIAPSRLVIHHGRKAIEIPLAEIQASEVVAVSKAYRVFGTRIPGYCQGKFRFPETETVSLYGTCQSPLVVIETASLKYGLNPSDPAAFVAALQAGNPSQWLPARTGAGPSAWWTLGLPIIGVVAVTLAALLVLYFVYLPRWLRYRLTDELVLIDGGLLKARIPYHEIIEVGEATPPGRPSRIAGTDLGHVFWGRFSWRQAGTNFRLYATQVKPLVLIRTARRTYGLTPSESEQFVSELRQRLDAIGGYKA